MDKRKIVVKNYYRDRDLYLDDLGWQENEKIEAGSFVSKEIFHYEVVYVGLNLAFYYIDNDTFYGIHTEAIPIEVKILPRDRSVGPYIGWQCDGNTHRDGEVIASFERAEDIWDNLKIDGKSLEEVLERSYIITLN